jgi:hypothetical protein
MAATAGSVTIGITTATDETGQPTLGAGTGTSVPVTSENVTTIDGSLYTFACTAAWDQYQARVTPCAVAGGSTRNLLVAGACQASAMAAKLTGTAMAPPRSA